jgi:hypothetical protein
VSGSSTEPGSRADRALLSIVVVSFNGERLLARCLEALATEARLHPAETLVVRNRPRAGSLEDRLSSAFPGVRWVDTPPACTIPRMRSLGIAAAEGNIIALVEDDCLVQPGWCQALLTAYHATDGADGAPGSCPDSHTGAVGGAVEPRPYRRALDWAVYFCDYGRFMLPLDAGPAVALPGNNMSFTKAALARLPAESRDEFLEVSVQRAWQRTRVPVRADPAVLVRNVNEWTLAHVTSLPYHHGRAFAGRRVAGQPLSRRAAMSVLALALPVLKVTRVVGAVVSRRRLIGPLLVGLPWIVVWSTCWSAGECVGYLAGPGESPSKWQ